MLFHQLCLLFFSLSLVFASVSASSSRIPTPSEAPHTAAAAIAQQFLTPEASQAINQLIPDVQGHLSAVVNFAQEVRSDPAYEWVAPLHLAMVPDWSCSYNRSSNCPSGVCNDGAVGNYTRRVLDQTLNFDQRNEAFKFLIHFIVDTTQPLHVANRGDLAGFKLTGSFLGKSVDLHTVWDDRVTAARIANDFAGHEVVWVQKLVNQSMTYSQQQIDQIVDCQGAGDQYGACSEVWANEAAALACQYAYVQADGKTRIANHFKLGQDYYNIALNVVETQIIKAGFRMANVLNAMFSSGKTEQISTM